jgi:hypothetical protein
MEQLLLLCGGLSPPTLCRFIPALSQRPLLFSRIWAPGKERSRVTARSLLCYWAVRDLGLSMAELRKLGLSLSGLSQSVKRGEKLAQDKGYRLIDY